MLENFSNERTWHFCAITANNIPFLFFWRPQSFSPTYTPIWLCLDRVVHIYVQIMRKQVSEILPSLAPRLRMLFALIQITVVQILGGSSKIACPANSRVILSITGQTRQISDGLCVRDDLRTSYLESMLIDCQITSVTRSVPASMVDPTVSHAPIRTFVRMSAAQFRAASSPILGLQGGPPSLHSAVINFFPVLMNVRHATLL